MQFILLNESITVTVARDIYGFFCHVDPMTDMDIQELANLTAGDADVDNFERLFTKLKEMKGEATPFSCPLLLHYRLSLDHISLFFCSRQSVFNAT